MRVLLYPALQQPVDGAVQNTVPRFESAWHQPWSEPVRFKHIHVSRIASGMVWRAGPVPPVNPWFAPLALPVRLKKGLRAPFHPYFFMDTEWIPRANTFVGWYSPYSIPVRLPKGLRAQYQQDLAYHPRLLPPVDVTITMSVLEVNNDIFEAGLSVSDGASGANVSIEEIQAGNDAALSISV